MINLTAKLGEINNIERNKGCKIYPQNQVILDCIMVSKNIYIYFFFFFYFRQWEKRWLFSIGNGAEIEGQIIPCYFTLSCNLAL